MIFGSNVIFTIHDLGSLTLVQGQHKKNPDIKVVFLFRKSVHTYAKNVSGWRQSPIIDVKCNDLVAIWFCMDCPVAEDIIGIMTSMMRRY